MDQESEMIDQKGVHLPIREELDIDFKSHLSDDEDEEYSRRTPGSKGP